jgi:hypothetical protein
VARQEQPEVTRKVHERRDWAEQEPAAAKGRPSGLNFLLCCFCIHLINNSLKIGLSWDGEEQATGKIAAKIHKK